jgi:predicted AAA+ superfamily ATPase
MVNDYPFHPELLTTLNRKTSTIPNFQKTRGALRLLALAHVLLAVGLLLTHLST